MTSSRTARIAGVILLVLFAALYLLTLDNGLRPGELEGGDLITHQYAQVQGRFSNAPGYPLYTMGGWLWFRTGRLLLGADHNPIQILSAYSTLWALLALALLYGLCLQVTRPGRWPVAALVTAFFGLTYFFWYYAVTTEQYTSSVAWTLAVVLLAFRWEQARRDGYLLGLALLMGVGLAHQVTVLAILPPLLWFVLAAVPRPWRPERWAQPGVAGRLRSAARVALLVVLPLLSYIFVYVRGSQHPEWRGAGEWASNLDWFLSFISTGQGRSELTWSLQPFFTAEFPALIWREMTWPALLAGLAGIAALGRRRAVLLYATIAIYLVFCWIDRLGNWYQVIMPVYALLAIGLAAGVDWVTARWPQRWVRALALVSLVALVAYRGVVSYPRVDASDRSDDTALMPGRLILADDPPLDTPVLTTQAEALSLNYLTDIWGRRPDLQPVSSVQAAALLQHQPVAVTRDALPIVRAEVDPAARYGAIGRTLSWIRSAPIGEAPPDLIPWRYPFGSDLLLLGGRALKNPVTDEDVVLLAWQAQSAPRQDWSVSVRLLSNGREIGLQDHENPVWGAYPTGRWTAGEVVTDTYAFASRGVEPDGLRVILYRPDGAGGYLNLAVADLPLE